MAIYDIATAAKLLGIDAADIDWLRRNRRKGNRWMATPDAAQMCQRMIDARVFMTSSVEFVMHGTETMALYPLSRYATDVLWHLLDLAIDPLSTTGDRQ